MTSNLDSILSMGHNFYVYVPEKLGLIQFIPWDLNEAFGGFGMGTTPTTQLQLSLVHAYAGENQLIQRILAIPRFKQQYFKIVRELAAGAFSIPAMNARIDALTKLTSELMAQEKKDGLSVGQPGGPGGPDGVRGGQGFNPGNGGGRPGGQGDFGPGNGGGRPGDFDPGGFGPGNSRPVDNGPRGGPGGFGPGPGGPPGDGPQPNDAPREGGPQDGPRGGEPGNGRPGNGPNAGGNGRGQMRNGPGGNRAGGPRGRPAKPELKPFVAARNQSIADQLAGKTNGEIPANNRMPGGGGPGQRNGGGFGGNQPPR